MRALAYALAIETTVVLAVLVILRLWDLAKTMGFL
jgi:hypothetical protein